MENEVQPQPHHVASDAADPSPTTTLPFVSRAASELEYHARVLAGAANRDEPLLERVRFCSFFTSLTDEFFRVRLAGMYDDMPTDGTLVRAHRREIQQLRRRWRELSAEQHRLWDDELRPALHDAGIHLLTWDQLTEEQRELGSRVFDTEIFPLLTPLAVGPANPFPFISDLSLSLGVSLDPSDGGPAFARVKVPESLDRFVTIAGDDDDERWLIRVEEVMGAHIGRLFPGRTVTAWHLFRVTRNADYDVDDRNVDDLRAQMVNEIHDRRFGAALRLEVVDGMPEDVRRLLQDHLELGDDMVVEVRGPLDLAAVGDLYDLDRPDLKRDSWSPLEVSEFESGNIFARLRRGDILVHHPYESFAGSVQRFIETAAEDPRVLAIKQTLYRTSSDSPMITSMMRAVAEGKQAVVLVELKARFDEANNIGWAEKLEAAGVHVVYGFVTLKTHTKTALVVRRDEDGVIRRYVHVATGNYNPKTARFYEDLGLFTADPVITADVGQLFNMLTGHSHDLRPERLLIAPTTLKERLLQLIDSQAHGDGRIIMKANHLAHPEIMDALIRASQAGCDIDLILRTTACLVPGVEGMTERIRVRSVAAPFLEHSRIYRFGHTPEPGGVLIGSADLMPRNLDNRVEAVVPVDDEHLRARLDMVLEELLADEAHSWIMQSDGSWHKAEGARSAQANLKQWAVENRRKR